MSMKLKTIQERVRYEKPALKEFKVSLEWGCCQMNLSNNGLPTTSGENTDWD